jgi:NitT/TauT family transport system substrate-binding protein
VREQNQPVRVGYHSPANAPVIIFEETVRSLGLSVTEDPVDFDADILLINLRGTANLIPALLSGEVDAWVGPSPFPELAVLQGDGRLIIDLKDLPPGGRWTEFPCCVFSASNEALANYRDIIVQFYKLLTIASDFANTDRESAGQIVSDWMGVDVEAAKNTMTIFTTDISQNWLDHSELIVQVLQDNGTLEGAFRDLRFYYVKPEAFDLSIAEQALR